MQYLIFVQDADRFEDDIQGEILPPASSINFEPERTNKVSDSRKPQDEYLPPKDEYLPPKDEYLPPATTTPAPVYLPPQDTYLPPTDEYLPPQQQKVNWNAINITGIESPVLYKGYICNFVTVIYRFERVIIPIPIWLWDFATRSALVST
jgi:hypothetical protein